MNECVSIEGGGKSGCLRAALAGPVLVFLAPVVALLRTLARMRRGSQVRVRSDERPFRGTVREQGILLSMVFDVPSARDISREVTDRAVRIAESLAGGGESYHLLRREPGSGETVVVSFGSSVQEFAERFLISCRRTAHLDHRIVWVVLPPGELLGASLDPLAVDPDAAGQPEGLLGELPFLWAIAIKKTGSLSSRNWEILLAGPSELRTHAERLAATLTKTIHE